MDRAELIAAIRRADPDDPAPVLVYADWLQDRDDPRGELIAAEHAGQRRPDLLAAHEREWLAPIEALGAFRPRLDRGLVRWVSLRGKDAANLDAICDLEPVTGVGLDSLGERPAAAVLASRALDEIRSLNLGGKFDAGCDAILASPRIANLESLGVSHPLTPGRAAALVAAGPRPAWLSARLTAEAAAILAAGATLDRVVDLRLFGDGLPAFGERLDRLETLHVELLGRADVDALVRHATSGRLRRLDTHVADHHAQVKLLGSKVLAGLEVIDMQSTALCPAAVKALQRNPHRGKLRSMWLPEMRRQRFELPGVEIEWEGW